MSCCGGHMCGSQLCQEGHVRLSTLSVLLRTDVDFTNSLLFIVKFVTVRIFSEIRRAQYGEAPCPLCMSIWPRVMGWTSVPHSPHSSCEQWSGCRWQKEVLKTTTAACEHVRSMFQCRGHLSPVVTYVFVQIRSLTRASLHRAFPCCLSGLVVCRVTRDSLGGPGHLLPWRLCWHSDSGQTCEGRSGASGATGLPEMVKLPGLG